MNKTNGEQLVELVGLDADDGKVLSIFELLELDIPLFGEEFQRRERASIYDDDKAIAIVFKENDDYSDSGEAIIEQVDFYKEGIATFPLGLHKSDDYETVIEKIGKKPDFCDKDMPWSKQWVFSFDDKEIVYAIHFKPDMKSINTIVVAEFERDGIEEDEFIFPCEELEA